MSEIGHANGVSVLQGLDPDFLPRPSSISTSGVAGGSNWQSGGYVFDGSGNVVRIGESLFLYDPVSRVKSASVVFTPEGFAPPAAPPSPDLLGLVHIFSDGFESGTTGAWTVPPGPTNGVQTFTYDAFGNLTDIVGDPAPPIGIDAQTNRVSGSSYDAAGNQLSWLVPEGGANSYSYGPFNEVWRVATPAEEWVHVYTADDERLMSWQVGGEQVNRWTLRGLDNRVLREYRHSRTGAPSFIERDNIYRGSGPLLAAATPAGDRHYHVDHLGTPRQITDSTGAQVAFHTYWPYGEEATLPNQDAVRYKFTGHERDFGNPATPSDDHDHMHARMSNPRLGRFLSVDPVGGSVRAPQSWNRYSYVRGNPLKYTDPTGEFGVFFIAELAATAIDVYEAWRTVTNTDKSAAEKILTTSLAIGGIAAPAGGATLAKGFIDNAVRNAEDAVVAAGKALDAATGRARMAGEGVAAFHHTFDAAVDSIRTSGLRPGSYATPTAGLSPLQAHIELALDSSKGPRNAILQIDLAGMRAAGFDIPEVTRVRGWFGMPGGGYEMRFPYAVPPEFISIVTP